MKKLFTLLMSIMALFALNANATTYKINEGSLSDAAQYGNYTYYKTWTSGDGALTMETSGYLYGNLASGWFYLYNGTYTIKAKEGSTINTITITYPKAGNDGSCTLKDANGNAITMEAGQYPAGNKITLSNINANSTTFTIEGESGYMMIYAEYGYMTFDVTTNSGQGGDQPGQGQGGDQPGQGEGPGGQGGGPGGQGGGPGGQGGGPGGQGGGPEGGQGGPGGQGGGPEGGQGGQPGGEAASYTLAEGTFSNPYSGTYYQTWTSSDGSLTITTSSYMYYQSGNYAYFFPGTYTITAAQNRTISEIVFGQVYGNNMTVTIEGQSVTATSTSTGVDFSVTDLNKQTVTMTITGNSQNSLSINTAATFNLAGQGGQGGGPGPNDGGQGGPDGPGNLGTVYKVIEGTFSNPISSDQGDYYKEWTSVDGKVTMSAPNGILYQRGVEGVFIKPGEVTITATDADAVLSEVSLGSVIAYSLYRSGVEATASVEGTTLKATNDLAKFVAPIDRKKSVTLTVSSDDPNAMLYLNYAAAFTVSVQGGQQPQGNTKSYTMSDGTFSNVNSSVYYRTWTSSDGKLQLKHSYYFYYSDSYPSWTSVYAGTITITALEGTLKEINLGTLASRRSAQSSEPKANLELSCEGVTDAHWPIVGSSTDDYYSFVVSDINKKSVNLVVKAEDTGTSLQVLLDKAVFTLDPAGVEQGGEQKTEATYTFDDGEFINQAEKSNRYAGWKSSDDVVTISGNSESGKNLLPYNNFVYIYSLGNQTYTIKAAEGYVVTGYSIASAYVYTEDCTITDVTTGKSAILELYNKDKKNTMSFEVTGLNTNSAGFTITTASGENGNIVLKPANFNVSVKKVSGSAARGMETTGIENVTTERTVKEGIFDLQGRRVQNPQKGLYIVNGKKVIFK